MSSVGPTAERKDERLERAVDVAGRLLDNIEIAIRGKREEVKLVLAALACKGHVLFEDVPGTAKTVLARAIAQSIEGAAPPGSSAPRTCSRPTSRVSRSGTSRPGTSSSEPARSSRTSSSSTRSTARCRRRSRRCSRRWRSASHDRRRHAGAERAVHRPRHPEPDRARGHLPAARGAARPLLRPNRARLPGRRRRAQHRPRPASRPPLAELETVVSVEEMNALQEATTVVYVDDLLQRWIIDLVRTTRELDIVAIGASVRGSPLSSGPFAAGRSSRAATTSPRRTSSSCSCRCLDTGSCSRRHSSSRSARSAASRRWRTSAPAVWPSPLDRRPRSAATAKSCRSSIACTVSAPTELSFPLVPRRRLIGLAFGRAQRQARERLRRRQLPSVPARRRLRRDRLGRLGQAVVGVRHRRVHRPRALCRGGAEGRDRL